MNRIQKIIIGISSVILVGCIVLFALHIRFTSEITALQDKDTETIRVATYNVHYIIDQPGDGRWFVNGWESRKEALTKVVGTLAADIIGFQEMETFGGGSVSDANLTLEWLIKNHPEFSVGAVGDPAAFPSTQPIFYRQERFTLLDQGWFFFSETPDVIYSRTFNESYPAFASWVELREIETNTVFKVVNIHTDFSSYSNRRQSLELVRDRIEPRLQSDEAVLVIGDFNAWLGSRLHKIIEGAGLTFAPVWSSTYHFDRGWHLFPAIDHVSFSDDFTIDQSPVVLQKQFQDVWPTDHYPVIVDLQYQSR